MSSDALSAGVCQHPGAAAMVCGVAVLLVLPCFLFGLCASRVCPAFVVLLVCSLVVQLIKRVAYFVHSRSYTSFLMPRMLRTSCVVTTGDEFH
jgi:hypothetical protein